VKRLLLLGGLAAVVIAAGIVYVVGSRLDSIVAAAIEHYGSEISGVPVRVRSVSLSLREGRGTIRGLRAGNPEGFSSGDAFRLGDITLDIDPRSVVATPLVVEALHVGAPEVNFELDAKGRSNFDAIRRNVDRYAAGSGAPEQESTGSEPAEATRVAIRHFAFANGRVRADVSAVREQEEPLEVALPPLTLANLGGKRGATPGEIGKTVLAAFTRAVVRSVAASRAQRALEDEIGGEAGRAAGELLRGILD
jgi:hypothetical protein